MFRYNNNITRIVCVCILYVLCVYYAKVKIPKKLLAFFYVLCNIMRKVVSAHAYPDKPFKNAVAAIIYKVVATAQPLLFSSFIYILYT